MTVLVESMKLRDAQKIPERTLLSSFQDLSTLDRDTHLLTALWLYLCNSKSCVASFIQPQLTAKSMIEQETDQVTEVRMSLPLLRDALLWVSRQLYRSLFKWVTLLGTLLAEFCCLQSYALFFLFVCFVFVFRAGLLCGF